MIQFVSLFAEFNKYSCWGKIVKLLMLRKCGGNLKLKYYFIDRKL